jgi:hypothetical protein
MKTLAVTLAADGSSDRCLLRPIRWAFRQALHEPVAMDVAEAPHLTT